MANVPLSKKQKTKTLIQVTVTTGENPKKPGRCMFWQISSTCYFLLHATYVTQDTKLCSSSMNVEARYKNKTVLEGSKYRGAGLWIASITKKVETENETQAPQNATICESPILSTSTEEINSLCTTTPVGTSCPVAMNAGTPIPNVQTSAPPAVAIYYHQSLPLPAKLHH